MDDEDAPAPKRIHALPLLEDALEFRFPTNAEEKRVTAAAVCSLILTLYKDLLEA